MVFDFFNGGELFHYLSQGGRFSEERSKLYTAEICLALERAFLFCICVHVSLLLLCG
jgi:serine/threonine protein kinase